MPAAYKCPVKAPLVNWVNSTGRRNTSMVRCCDGETETETVTPVLQPAEARQLLDTIDTSTLRGLRDRALLAVMVYSFARVSAVVGMRVEDYYQ